MWKARSRWVAGVLSLSLAAGVMATCARAQVAPGAVLDVKTLSNRADLISGGDALVEIVVSKDADPARLSVRLDGADVSGRFARRGDGRILGLVDHLKDGPNTLAASLGQGRGRRLVITNHPIGGPVFTGPQIQPWRCDTTAISVRLGPAVDAQCNAPAKYTLVYKHAITGKFRPYDPADPPGPMFIAKTTTDEGRTVPYIVRIETGTINRGVYDVAVLFDPSQPWEPWAPQADWNRKLEWRFGCAAGTAHRQAKDRGCYFFDEGMDEVLDQPALSRGFMVGASTQTNLGNDLNTAIHAETLMMVKEHIVEAYGEIRYTISQGGSGGSMSQHAVAEQYPGLLDGLRPTASFPDLWSVIAVSGIDCALLNNYFDKTSPGLWTNLAQKDAVYGYGLGAPADSGTDFCHGKGAGSGLPWLWLPGAAGPGGNPLTAPCAPLDQIYDPKRNPAGVRCSAQDYMVNVFGSRPAARWGPVEKAVNRGFANRALDRVGVQYGLKALEAGAISPEQFVDLNGKVGGWDIDANWQPQRTEADPGAVATMYRTGQIVEGRELATVPIIDYRRDVHGDVHANRQAAFVRERLKKANGTAGNRAEWIEPQTIGGEAVIDNGRQGAASVDESLSLRVLDSWVAAIKADRSNRPLSEKVIRDRPAEAADGCFVNAKRADAGACAGYKVDSDPLLVAGMPEARDILKCQLKPLRRSDYKAVFTQDQWRRLQAAFPTGVCDWSRPGVGQQQASIPWLSYADGPGGEPLPPAPRSTPIAAHP